MANQTMAVIKIYIYVITLISGQNSISFFFFKYTDSKLEPFSYGYIVCMYHVLNLIHTIYQLFYLDYSQIKVFRSHLGAQECIVHLYENITTLIQHGTIKGLIFFLIIKEKFVLSIYTFYI